MCPMARAASQPSLREGQEFPSLSKPLSSQGLALSHLLPSKSC